MGTGARRVWWCMKRDIILHAMLDMSDDINYLRAYLQHVTTVLAYTLMYLWISIPCIDVSLLTL